MFKVKLAQHGYLPALYRQTTEALPSTKLREEISRTLRKTIREDIKPALATRQEFLASYIPLMPHLKHNAFGLEVREKPIYAGDIPQWNVYRQEYPSFMLTMKVGKLTGKHLEAGYFYFPMPEKTSKNVKVYNLDVRSEDKLNLSPKKMYHALYQVLEAGIEKLKQTADQEIKKTGTTSIVIPEVRLIEENNQHYLLYIPPRGGPVEIIPTIAVSNEGPFFVAKPHLIDENPNSDMLWRVCYASNEEAIMKTVASGDKNQRLLAATLISTMCKKEWKLCAITPYHIKNVLLHEIDFQVDNSPRWQRFPLDECVRLLLIRLTECVRSKRLTQFFEEDFNLWSHFSDRQFSMMKSSLERLMRDEKEIIRVLKRMRVEPINFT